MNEQRSPDETELVPHKYEECYGTHLFERAPHCWRCDEGPDHPIHKGAA